MSGSAGVPRGLGDALATNADRIRPFGSRIVHLSEVGSTNDVAAVLASGGTPEGTLVIADAQTAGRGRMGHAWQSPTGSEPPAASMLPSSGQTTSSWAAAAGHRRWANGGRWPEFSRRAQPP